MCYFAFFSFCRLPAFLGPMPFLAASPTVVSIISPSTNYLPVATALVIISEPFILSRIISPPQYPQLNHICINSFLPFEVIYSQVPGIRVWIYLGRLLFSLPHLHCPQSKKKKCALNASSFGQLNYVSWVDLARDVGM